MKHVILVLKTSINSGIGRYAKLKDWLIEKFIIRDCFSAVLLPNESLVRALVHQPQDSSQGIEDDVKQGDAIILLEIVYPYLFYNCISDTRLLNRKSPTPVSLLDKKMKQTGAHGCSTV